MSDLAGGILALKSPRTEADGPMLFDLMKVAADHGVCVVFGGNIVQHDIHAMIGIAFCDEAIAFAMSGSPVENTAENLVNPYHLLEQNAERDAWLRERLNGIRAFLAAAFGTGRVSAELVVFSEADATEDPYPTETTELAGFVETCMRHISVVESFVPSLRVWITAPSDGR